ncbi:hypothetical protein D3871_28285 [Noviherbaspirillum saxi]|uniref:Uncharacterized protein n=2 Tax=Noviherbaspirillum saxi TaxID=2320863 RepID=A0A3A3FGJ1_9BURK|nr:hypothetical protein D3871_28285 [Noviherbaspirillum saxi]
MLKTLVQSAAGFSLLAASALVSATEPLALSEHQMDHISAGSIAGVPNAGQLSSIGALAWAMSQASATPGVVVVIDGHFTAQVGLGGNGTTFTHTVRIIRPT